MVLLLWIFLIVMLHVGICCIVVSVPCGLVVICWERADILVVVFVVFCHFPKCVLVHIRIKGEVGAMKQLVKPLQLKFLLTVPRRYFFCGSFMLNMSCVLNAFASGHCCLVVACWERADLLAFVCDVMYSSC